MVSFRAGDFTESLRELDVVFILNNNLLDRIEIDDRYELIHGVYVKVARMSAFGYHSVVDAAKIQWLLEYLSDRPLIRMHIPHPLMRENPQGVNQRLEVLPDRVNLWRVIIERRTIW